MRIIIVFGLILISIIGLAIVVAIIEERSSFRRYRKKINEYKRDF